MSDKVVNLLKAAVAFKQSHKESQIFRDMARQYHLCFWNSYDAMDTSWKAKLWAESWYHFSVVDTI